MDTLSRLRLSGGGSLHGVRLSQGVRLVVFDFAGTTIRDDGRVMQSMIDAFSENGVQVTAAQLAEVRGMAKREAIAALLPVGLQREARGYAVESSFRRHVADRLTRQPVEPIAGADEVFQWLRSQDVHIALNTGFDRDTTQMLLDALGWTTRFDATVCADDVSRGRPAPDMIFRAMGLTGIRDSRDVANVGDTAADLHAAHAAGVRWNIGVLSGAHDRDRLEGAPHTHLLPSVADLRTALRF